MLGFTNSVQTARDEKGQFVSARSDDRFDVEKQVSRKVSTAKYDLLYDLAMPVVFGLFGGLTLAGLASLQNDCFLLREGLICVGICTTGAYALQFVLGRSGEYVQIERYKTREKSDVKQSAVNQQTLEVRPIRVEIWEQSGNGFAKRVYEPAFGTDLMLAISAHCLNGGRFAQAGLAHLMSTNQYANVKTELLEAGLVYELNRRGEVEVSSAGRAVMRRLLEAGENQSID